jgi:hypothetical protein
MATWAHLVGTAARQGANAGVAAPLLAAAYVSLVVHQTKLGAAR